MHSNRLPWQNRWNSLSFQKCRKVYKTPSPQRKTAPTVNWFPALEWADFSHCSLTDEILASLNKCPKLGTLWLSENPITGTGFASLQGLNKLSEIDVRGCSISEEGAAVIARLPAVQLLKVSKMSDEALRSISRCKSISNLGFFGDGGGVVSATMLSDITAMPSLNMLQLETDVELAGVTQLASAKKLDGLIVHFKGVDDGWIESLAKLKNLSKLSLRDTRITDAGLAALKKAMPKCKVEK